MPFKNSKKGSKDKERKEQEFEEREQGYRQEGARIRRKGTRKEGARIRREQERKEQEDSKEGSLLSELTALSRRPTQRSISANHLET